MEIFVQIYINIIKYKKSFEKNLTFGPRQGPRTLPWAIHLYLYKHYIKDFFSFNKWCLFI